MLNSNGKGSRPRNCFSDDFRTNYSEINWKSKVKKIEEFWNVCGHCGGDGYLIEGKGYSAKEYKCYVCSGSGEVYIGPG